uniref:CCDC66 domain-containing protein n=1 Tax=Macrostomum lignano TaxID=282301 RepID=A0A1I8GSG9_9PLAT
MEVLHCTLVVPCKAWNWMDEWLRGRKSTKDTFQYSYKQQEVTRQRTQQSSFAKQQSRDERALPISTTERLTPEHSHRSNSAIMENDRVNKLISEYLQPQKNKQQKRHQNTSYTMSSSGCRCCAQINLANRLKRLAQTGGGYTYEGNGQQYQTQHHRATVSLVPIDHSTQRVNLDQLTDDEGWRTKERAVSRSLKRMEDSVRRLGEQLEQLKLQQESSSKSHHWSQPEPVQSPLYQRQATPDQLPAGIQASASKDQKLDGVNHWQPRLASGKQDNTARAGELQKQQPLPEMQTDNWRYAALQPKKFQPAAVGAHISKRTGWSWDEQEL